MKVSFEGIGELVCTFYNSQTNGVKVGQTVKMSGNSEVSACAEGSRFFGVALDASEAFASVQTGGFVLLPYSDAAPSIGYCKLAADGRGGVKADAGGGEHLVVDVDSTAKTVGFML